MSQPAVQLDNISVQIAGQNILVDLSWKLFRGQKVAVMGPSGSGKSTLFRVIAGLCDHSGSRILESGLSLSKVFQKNALFDSMSSLENTMFPLMLRGVGFAERQKRARQLLEMVGLSNSEHLFPAELSGGMQKRLGLARALATRPELLLCDDPSAGLDPILGREIFRVLAELTKESTLVVTTNELARARQVADQLLVLMEGKIVYQGSFDALNTAEMRVKKFLFPRSASC